MNKIESLQDLKSITGANENVWLLLFKKGSEQSDCALKNYKHAEKYSADKRNVTDYWE